MIAGRTPGHIGASPELECGLRNRRTDADTWRMRHTPRWLKLLAVVSLAAEATAVAAVLWPRR